MTVHKPTRELLRIYAVEDEVGKMSGLMIASKIPDDLTRQVITMAHEMLEKNKGQHINDIKIRDPCDMSFHTEA
jgi:hypothetical protein